MSDSSQTYPLQFNMYCTPAIDEQRCLDDTDWILLMMCCLRLRDSSLQKLMRSSEQCLLAVLSSSFKNLRDFAIKRVTHTNSTRRGRVDRSVALPPHQRLVPSKGFGSMSFCLSVASLVRSSLPSLCICGNEITGERCVKMLILLLTFCISTLFILSVSFHLLVLRRCIKG